MYPGNLHRGRFISRNHGAGDIFRSSKYIRGNNTGGLRFNFKLQLKLLFQRIHYYFDTANPRLPLGINRRRIGSWSSGSNNA